MSAELLNRASRRAAACLCVYRGLRFADTIASAVDLFSRRLDGFTWDIKNNGELRVLRLLRCIDPKVFFDVGANKGEWSLFVAGLYPACTIHAFEIIPSTYQELLSATEHDSRIRPNGFGLSDQRQTVYINYSDADSRAATACEIEGMGFQQDFYTRKIECTVRKASDYMTEEDVERIDFLKVDAEGLDLKVIKGFEGRLELVRVIQFEYGPHNISSHDLLYDFTRHLSQYGFILGKIYPRYVHFSEYHYDKEGFRGANYLAVRKGDEELVSILSKYGP